MQTLRGLLPSCAFLASAETAALQIAMIDVYGADRDVPPQIPASMSQVQGELTVGNSAATPFTASGLDLGRSDTPKVTA
jgi:hypothetical protein